MKLYYHPLSTYSQKTLMALYEKEVPFEREIVNLRDPRQRTAYRRLYPLGKIPLLVRDDGWQIPESTIIIEFLDTHSGAGPRLVPEDPELARRTRFTDRVFDLYLNDTVTALLFESFKPEEERNAETVERARFRAGVLYDYLEKAVGEHEWAVGEEFSMADCAAAPPLFYAQQIFPFTERPAIRAYWERLSARPSYGKVLEEAQPHLEAMRAASS